MGEAELSPVVRHRSTATGPYITSITPERAGWSYSGLRVLELPPGGQLELGTGPDEVIVLPLSGSATVKCGRQRFTLHGRRDVFDRVTDFAYLPRDAEAVIGAADGGRFALPSARASERLAPRYVAAEQVPVELRGAGSASLAGQQLLRPRGLPGRPADRRGGTDPRGELVLLPAAQA